MSKLSFVLPFIASASLSFLLTWGVRRFAMKKNVVDKPETEPTRKIHTQPIPLLGGVGIFAAFSIIMLWYVFVNARLLGGYLLPKHLAALFLAGLLIMIGGYIDDRYRVRFQYQILWPLVAILILIVGGIGIEYVTNPFGGIMSLNQWSITVFHYQDLPYKIILFADVFTVIWLMMTSYTTKLLDGLDGLVSGITVIGGLLLFVLSLNTEIGQPETALLSIILAGSFAGFLVWNYHPAKIFLGEGGSLFAGFMLGTVAILSGAKIATALLLLGIPLLDVIWVIIRRVLLEKKHPLKTSDKKHIHFRLLEIGLSHRQAVHVLYVLSLIFGLLSLFVTHQGIVWLLVSLVGFMIIFGAVLALKSKH